MEKSELQNREAEFRVACEQAGLTRSPATIVGCGFHFFTRHGSHTCTVAGKIEGVSFSDEGGVRLDISNRRFWGKGEIINLQNEEGSWSLTVAFENPGSKKDTLSFPGHLKLMGK